MKIIDREFTYELTNIDDKEVSQLLKFIKTSKIEGVREVLQDGTTTEDVIDVLLNRVVSQNKKFYSTENQEVIIKLQEIRDLLDLRSKRIKDNANIKSVCR